MVEKEISGFGVVPYAVEKDDSDELKAVLRYRARPVEFIYEQVFGGYGVKDSSGSVLDVDKQQEEILNAVAWMVYVRRKKAQGSELVGFELSLYEFLGISIRAPKGTGKTTVFGWVLIWFMSLFGTDIKNLITAPKLEQLNDNLLSEVSKWLMHARETIGESCFIGKYLEVKDGEIRRVFGINKQDIGKSCVTLCRTSKVNADGSGGLDALSGYHANYQILGIEECYGVHDKVFEPLTTTMTRMCNFAFMIGNPTRNKGYAAASWVKNNDQWLNIQMTLERSGLHSGEYIKRIEREYAGFPNLLRIYRDGLPPLEDDNCLIRWDAILECFELNILRDSVKTKPIVGMLDVGMGGDNSAVCVMQGNKVLYIGEKKCRDTDENIDYATYIIDMYGIEYFGVDNIGVGKGTFDGLKKLHKGKVKVFGVCASSTSGVDTNEFKNLRAKLIMDLAEDINKCNLDISCIEDTRLKDKIAGELNSIQLINLRPIQVESKEHMRNRGIKSPNIADAMYGCYYFKNRISTSVSPTNRSAFDKVKCERDTAGFMAA